MALHLSQLRTSQSYYSHLITMVQRDREVKNAARREWLAQQDRKTKSKAKLNRRLATKKAEREDATGELRRQRLATNVPRTIENTREWVGGGPSAPAYQNKRRKAERDDDDEDEDEDEDDESDDEEDDGFGSEGEEGGPSDRQQQQNDDKDTGDARLRPVQVKAGTENSEELVLDMAGLEDLFPADPEYEQPQGQDPEASTSAMPQGPPPHKPILLTTSPRPHGPTYAFLNELQSLLGGKRYAQVVPRKNKRFELSRVVKWATKRGYGAIIVVGEDLHGEPGEWACQAVNSMRFEAPC